MCDIRRHFRLEIRDRYQCEAKRLQSLQRIDKASPLLKVTKFCLPTAYSFNKAEEKPGFPPDCLGLNVHTLNDNLN